MIAKKYSLLQMEYTAYTLLDYMLDDRGPCCNAHRQWAKDKWDS